MPDDAQEMTNSSSPQEATITQLLEAIGDAIKGLLTVEVRTLVGDDAFASGARLKDGDASKALPAGTQGAFTSCDMASGDVTICYSKEVVDVAKIKELHDEAVALGTGIFKTNLQTLTDLLKALTKGS